MMFCWLIVGWRWLVDGCRLLVVVVAVVGAIIAGWLVVGSWGLFVLFLVSGWLLVVCKRLLVVDCWLSV